MNASRHQIITVLVLCLVSFLGAENRTTDQSTALAAPALAAGQSSDKFSENTLLPYPPGDERWADIFYPPGPHCYVDAIATYGNDVYIGGSFAFVGNMEAMGTAHWDGNTWQALGDANIPYNYSALLGAIVADGSGNVYTAGRYATSYWNGNVWHAIGWPEGDGEVLIEVLTLASTNDGILYAGGNFTTTYDTATNQLVEASYIIQWDGNTWKALGSGTNGIVETIALDENNNLYVGGSFTTAGGVNANGIAMWDGSAWHALGSGLNTQDDHGAAVSSIAINHNDVYVLGDFTTAGGGNANGIAMWDGSAWHPIGDGTEAPPKCGGELAVNDHNIYNGGWACISRWNGSTWQSISGEIDGLDAMAMALDDSNNLYIGGSFTEIDGVPAHYLAKWDGSHWSAMVEGSQGVGLMFNYVPAMAIDDHDNVYIGGDFTTAGGVPANHIAMWDGAAWHALGSGLESDYDLDEAFVQALAIDDHGNVYVGGDFVTTGGIQANDIAMWDGTAWHALGGGTEGYGWIVINALAIDADGNLYAGGSFPKIGGVTANNIAMWDGTAWHALGSGIGSETSSWVRALAIDKNGNVYAGGGFSEAGGIAANNIAMWDGTTWHKLGSGIDSHYYRQPIETLITDNDGNLYAGGWFSKAGGVNVNNIAMWDGTAWHALGMGIISSPLPELYPPVNALVLDSNGDLYAGGDGATIAAEGMDAHDIARWDGKAWHTLGSGIGDGGGPGSLAIDSKNRLYAAGLFEYAGGRPSQHFARWDIPIAVGDRTWIDQNNNGLQDSGEPGLQGVTIRVLDQNDAVSVTVHSISSGEYLFRHLWSGNYTLEFIPPYGYGFTSQDQGGNDALDSDADPTSGRTTVLSLGPTLSNPNWDAGFVPLPFPLTVQVSGSATGTVTSTPAGIDCPAVTCTSEFLYQTGVTLEATPGPEAVFVEWSGDIDSIQPTLPISIAASTVLTATFQPPIAHFAINAQPDRLLANGIDTATLVVSATTTSGDGAPLAGRKINLDLANGLGEVDSSSLVLDASGMATTTFTTGPISGTEIISATTFENGLPVVITDTIILDPNPLTGQLKTVTEHNLITYVYTLTNAYTETQVAGISGSVPFSTTLISIDGASFSPSGGDDNVGLVYTDGISLAPGDCYTITWTVKPAAVNNLPTFLTQMRATSDQARLRLVSRNRMFWIFLPVNIRNTPSP